MSKDIFYNEKWYSFEVFTELFPEQLKTNIPREYSGSCFGCFCDCQCDTSCYSSCDCQCDTSCYSSCDCLPPCVTCHKKCDGDSFKQEGNGRLAEKPFTVHFELTEKCNHGCMYCFNDFRSSNNHHTFKQEELDGVLDKISTFSKSIIFTGGEPFLEPDVLIKGIEIATKKKFDFISINTNGTLVSRKVINLLHNINKSLNFLVSVPSLCEAYYREVIRSSYHRYLLQNVAVIIDEFGVDNVATNTVITKQNMHEIFDLANMLHSLGIRSFRYSFVSPPNKAIHLSPSLSDIKKSYALLRKARNSFPWKSFSSVHSFSLCRMPLDFLNKPDSIVKCNMGRSILAVDPQKNVKPCPELPSDKFGISLDQFIANGCKSLINYNDIETNIVQAKSICGSCLLFKYCGASCSARRYHNSVNIFSDDTFATELSAQEVRSRMNCLEKIFNSQTGKVEFIPKDDGKCHVYLNNKELEDIAVSQAFLAKKDLNRQELIKTITNFATSLG